MRFRVSIMPRNDITGTGGDSNETGGNTGTFGALAGSGGNISSSFVASNSKIGSSFGTFSSAKLSPLTEILDGGQSGMILSPDEITDVSFSASDFSVNSTANTESNVTVRIAGKLFSHIEESGAGLDSPLSMNSLLTGFMGDKLSGLTSGLNKGMQALGNVFTSNLSSTLTGMVSKLGGNKFGLNNLYSMNFENTIELANWALSYGEKTDYRDVVVEIVINEGLSKTYILPDMFAVDYDESLGVGRGEGYFNLILRQKRYSSRKIIIR
jgi:hypothetical protein